MLGVKFIVLGTLKESYLRDAVAEYKKRLGAFCSFSETEIKEEKTGSDPSESEIAIALKKEAEKILAEIPKKAFCIALCVEGKQFSSKELAERLEAAANEHSELCFIIGSSHGLATEVKERANLKLSISKLTFPHQLMRVTLLEVIYRSFNIQKGTKYHK